MTSEIELEIGPGATAGTYVARVLRAASGGEPSAVLDLDVDTLLGHRAALENAVLLSTVTSRRVAPVEEVTLRGVGQQLFDALFTRDIGNVYRASTMVAQRNGERLQIVLRLNAPGLAALPWEAMWDREVGAYTCLREPLIRHVPAPYQLDPLSDSGPLRILALTASPRGLPALDVDKEQEYLSDALESLVSQGLVEVEWLRQATWRAVHTKLLSGRWHVLHFIGHGDYDVDTEQGLIALVGQDGRKDLVDAERLATLLNEAAPTPRLVVLNSCSSGEEGSRDLFTGTAAALVRSGINAVAAMQFTISDAAAVRFASGFYEALAYGRDIAAALRAGRVEILGTPHTLEWVTPVLYLRGNNPRLFDLKRKKRSGGGHDVTATPDRPHTPPAPSSSEATHEPQPSGSGAHQPPTEASSTQPPSTKASSTEASSTEASSTQPPSSEPSSSEPSSSEASGIGAPRPQPQPTPNLDSAPLPPAGWYPDPSGRHEWRWFEQEWTPYVSDAGRAFTDEL